jgi:hypothetical protein
MNSAQLDKLASAFKTGLTKAKKEQSSILDTNYAIKIWARLLGALNIVEGNQVKIIFATNKEDPQEELRRLHNVCFHVHRQTLKLSDIFVEGKFQSTDIFKDFLEVFKKHAYLTSVVFKVKGSKDWVLTATTPAYRVKGMARVVIPSSTTSPDLQVMPMELFIKEVMLHV